MPQPPRKTPDRKVSDSDEWNRAAWQVEALEEQFNDVRASIRTFHHTLDKLEGEMQHKASGRWLYSSLFTALLSIAGAAMYAWSDAGVIHERHANSIESLRERFKTLPSQDESNVSALTRRVADLEQQLERLKAKKQ